MNPKLSWLIRTTLANLLFALFLPNAEAIQITSDFDSSIGYSNLNMSFGENFARTIESTSTIELNYNLNFSGADTAVQISFLETVDSQLGYLPFTRLALGARYYPFRQNGTRVLIDNGVQGRLWRASPFVVANAGFSSISIRDPDGQNNVNAFVVDGLFKAGVEIPVATDWLLLGQFGYLMSLMGEDETDPSRSASYGGILILVGFKLTSF